LFTLSEKLVDDELEVVDKTISYDKAKEHHERLIYGEKLANERKIRREKEYF